MTPEEAVAQVRKAGHFLMIHKGQVFFNTFDHAEMLKWEKLGAHIVPHWTLDEIALRRKKGRLTTPAWEVHILGACTRIEEEDANGDLVDFTAAALLAQARNAVAS